MRLSFLSDLHMGARGEGRCTTPAAELVVLLDALAARSDRTILVGDAFDLLRLRRPRDWSRTLQQLRTEEPALMRRLEGLDRVYGNHDAPLANLGVPEELEYHHGGHRIWVVHGHQWDVWLKRLWGMEESANFVAGWMERLRLDGVSAWMGEVPGRLVRRSAREERCGSEEDRQRAGALREARARGASVVVMGRSHELGLWCEGRVLLMGVGSHVSGRKEWGELEVAEGVAAEARVMRGGDVVAAARYDRAAGRWECLEQDGNDVLSRSRGR